MFKKFLVTKEVKEEIVVEAVKEEIVIEANKNPEELLRDAKFKIKLVAPTKFGTQIDFAKKYDDDAIKKVLSKFTLKFDGKSVFVID